jgi:membrane protein DedA with SNARE-associated domain
MAFGAFLVFNSLAAILWVFGTALPAYGAGKLASGHGGVLNGIEVVVGVALIAVVGWRLARRRRRSRAAIPTSAQTRSAP